VRPRRPIVIAGGGIGGLSAALALARVGLRSIVLERRAEPTEIGAGIQLTPNAGKALAWLGIPAEAADALSVHPERLEIRSGRSARLLATMPLGAGATERFGAPYRTLHRADLQLLLLAAARRIPDIDLRLGTELVELRMDGDGVTVGAVTGDRHREIGTDVLIGADGVRSVVRKALPGAKEAAFTGRVAWRAVAPLSAAAAPADAIGIWLGGSAHLVHYPVRGGRELNIVAIVNETAGGRSTDPADLLAHFASWSPDARAILAAPSAWATSPIMTLDPNGAWTSGRVALLGDAAHTFPPYLAQGAAFAMEDAVTLAAAIARQPDDATAALHDYRALRIDRTRRLSAGAAQAGRIYHMGRATAWTRNFALSLAGPLLLRRYDWIYRWQPPA
jgi:salicylate hydroxylase